MPHFPKVVDLYSGVGGLSLGASRAGFEVVSAFEIDKNAVTTHALNFPYTRHCAVDIGQLDGNKLLELSGLKTGELDGIIGGPPCQGFSSIGKNNPLDVRNDLFVQFFRLVSQVRPGFFVAENVPGILNPKYDTIRETALSYVKDFYHLLGPFKVKASDYGAPTTRTRIFFIGLDNRRYLDASIADNFALVRHAGATNVEMALKCLSSYIDPKRQTEAESWQKVDYSSMENGFYQQRVVDMVPPGVGNVDALKNFAKSRVSGFLGTIHSREVELRFSQLRHGQQDKISRCTRLDPNGFCPTLRAGTGSDKGSFQAVRPIHYAAPRVICPREAARLQGFPDWFQFHPTKWHSFRQIGNSVSPIVAEMIMKTIHQEIFQ